MSNQRPPGGTEGPTQDPERPQQTAGAARGRDESEPSLPPAPPKPWVDSDRTQAYGPRRRSIIDRLDQPDREPDSGRESSETLPPNLPAQPPPPPDSSQASVRTARQRVVGQRREGKGLRLVALLAGVLVAGVAAGAAAAWVTGWRPAFLAGKGEPPASPAADKPAADAPQAKPADPKPNDPKPADLKPGDPKPGDTAKPPPGGEVTRACFAGTTEIKAGAGACGFALDGTGAITFKGAPLGERLSAGSGPAQRLVLYPFAPSGRYVFLRACESASGGRCTIRRLADTKEKKMFEVKAAAAGFAWVAWSPKEQVGLLGYRDGFADNIAAIATDDGHTLKAAAVVAGRNRYALVKQNTVRWTNEASFSVEFKRCAFKRGRARNKGCEDDDDVRYRRRTVKLSR